MKTAKVFFQEHQAGVLQEVEKGKLYRFEYLQNYQGAPVSLSMPISESVYEYETFPPFFDGLLPEGPQLEWLLKQSKLDRDDPMSQLITVGGDLVGAVTVKENL